MKKELIAGYERFGAYVFFFFFFVWDEQRERERKREREREREREKKRKREMSCDLRSFSGLERGRSISEDPS